MIYDIEKDSLVELGDLDGLSACRSRRGCPRIAADVKASALKTRGDYWRWSGRAGPLFAGEEYRGDRLYQG